MADTAPRLYEGLFLINQQLSGESEAAVGQVRDMLERVESEVVAIGRWDERKLAYQVDNQRRGLYIYALFRVRPSQIANIERDCNLSDEVLRVLMTRAEHMGDLEIERAVEEAKTGHIASRLHDEDEPDTDTDTAEDDADTNNDSDNMDDDEE